MDKLMWKLKKQLPLFYAIIAVIAKILKPNSDSENSLLVAIVAVIAAIYDNWSGHLRVTGEGLNKQKRINIVDFWL